MNFNIYADGPVCMSVCASKNMTREEIEQRANARSPTDISSPWKISTDATFKGGESMPCICESDETCQHWLLNC